MASRRIRLGHAHGFERTPSAVAQGEVDRASALVAGAARIGAALKNVNLVPALGEKRGPKAPHEARTHYGGVL